MTGEPYTTPDYRNQTHNFSATTAPTATDDAGSGYTAGSLWLNAATQDLWFCASSANDAAVWLPQRRTLAGNLILYVRPDGSDSNNGLTNTSAGAFLTRQAATDYILNRLIIPRGTRATIVVVGAHTDACVVSRPITGGGELYYQGDPTTPSNVTITTPSASCFTIEQGATATIYGIKMGTTGSGDCITTRTGGYTTVIGNDFGDCAGQHINSGSGTTLISGNYTISGDAVSHWHVGGGQGQITVAGTPTITLTGTPAFSAYFGGVSKGEIVCPGAIFSGSATGKKFLVHHNGEIKCLGQSRGYFPGDVAGEESDGGRWIGTLTYPIENELGYASTDLIPPWRVTAATDTQLSNTARLILMPVMIPHALSLSAIGLWPTVNGSAGVARQAIYRNDGRGRPVMSGGKIAEAAGTIDLAAGTVNAFRSAAISVALTEGLVWYATTWNVPGTMATVRTVTTRGAISSSNPIGSTPMSCLFANADYTAGLPDTLPALTPNNAQNVCPGALALVA